MAILYTDISEVKPLKYSTLAREEEEETSVNSNSGGLIVETETHTC